MMLASYNIQYSRGRDLSYDLSRGLAVVRDADVIALQEIERNWRRTGFADQPRLIEQLMPDRYCAYGAAFDVDDSTWENGRVVNRRRQFGQMTLSRWPIMSSRMHLLPKLDTGPLFCMTAGALETVIAAPGGPFKVLNIHLSHAVQRERIGQVEELLRVLGRAGQEGGAWNGTDIEAEHWQLTGAAPPLPVEAILLGDFNADPSSQEHRMICDPANKVKFSDAWLACGNDPAGGATFYKDPLQDTHRDIRIDYCFLSEGHAKQLKRIWVDGEEDASDHQPVWVELGS